MVKHQLHLETRGPASALICSKCKRPYLVIEGGKASIDSHHGSANHTNTLTISHLKMLLIEMIRQTQPEPEIW